MEVTKEIVKKIREFDEIVIARHIGPDPDAIASQIALRDIIKLNYPDKKVYAVGATVARFKYLGKLDKLNEDNLSSPLLIILDVPKFDRVDGVNLSKYVYTIKIDHHPCDEKVCDLDIVDESASSVCEMITDIAYHNLLKMDKSIAEKLFQGIVADSDRFLLSYTSPKTFNMCSMLLNDYKFDLMPLYNNLYERGLNERKFESYIINNITITENGLGHIKITNDIIKEFGVDASTASNMVNNLNFIKELKVWAFSSYDENLKLFKINIRSRGIVINEVAEQFGGGGHKFASGARLKTEEEVNELFAALDKTIKEDEEKNKTTED